ncbi:MAG: hypothetical protein ACXVCM_05455 [Ktedonobacteraceae bacterium]
MMNLNNPFNQYNQPYLNYLNTNPMCQRRRRSSSCMIGCIPVILVVVILLAGYFYFSDHILPQVPPFIIPILIACAVPVALVVFVLLFIRSRIQGKGFMASVKAPLLTLALFIGVIVVLIYSTRLAFPEVDMTRTAFTQTSVDASTGAHVHFVNPSNGIEQILCVGSNGHCAGVGLDPSVLLGSGLHVEPGQTVTVVFSDSGDFPITSKTMPGMNMTIHVLQDNSNDSGGD